ncbi:MAG: sigma-70 family RNA polymerase sigma factor [Candidatus Eisenbacteria bacterium]|uniref:Sigma-70 family RNA polymerase sigma factor n=1 Tax=Eiseniibacteriota bacterium TaxID=2212470 RepID=A0A956SED8_UNCEI|nr:sigma-70 family RNA polymerase sigma factor [Candidatus Eisenbacteria bacterium]MCB9462904.1 sigma-70 family RNA polymerase sigma factor [Candidatus Eisenbacteria bacterium]
MSETSAESVIPRDVLVRAIGREPAALEAFFDQVFPRVYRVVEKMVRQREAAEDVCQEVFYRIHRAIDRLDPERDPLPWVMTIAMNCCRKHWASKAESQAKRTTGIDDHPGLDERIDSGAPDPEALREDAVKRQKIEAALQELPEPMRESIVLHLYAGLGHDEIADSLGIGHAAARKRYSRAIARLGELLEDVVP